MSSLLSWRCRRLASFYKHGGTLLRCSTCLLFACSFLQSLLKPTVLAMRTHSRFHLCDRVRCGCTRLVDVTRRRTAMSSLLSWRHRCLALCCTCCTCHQYRGPFLCSSTCLLFACCFLQSLLKPTVPAMRTHGRACLGNIRE